MTESVLTSADIAAAFRQPMPKIRVTAGYRGQLLLVLFGLVMMQLLYLALIAAVMFATASYVLASFTWELSLNWLTLLIYAGPPIAGLIAIVFLFKPIAIRPPRSPEPLQLSREEELALFEFIDRLCDAIGAPRPARVFVTLDVNAAASLRGWRGLLFGEIDLTIGLPLAADFSLAEFAGVLAHEFGHFAQHAGMRSNFLIHAIQMWFARVVYQRDGWDLWLEENRNQGDYRKRAVAHLAALVVAGSRRYLALLMRGSAWIASGLSRQMEFDADRHQAALAGAAVAESCFRRLPVLQFGSSCAWKEAARDWEIGRLPDNVAHLMSARTALIPDEAVQQMVQFALAEKASRWDTHPSASERIESLQRDAYPGVLQVEGRAARLFRDLPALCRRATWHHYEKVLQISPDPKRLVSVAQSINEIRSGAGFEAAVQRLFGASAAECSQWLGLPVRSIGTNPPPKPAIAEFHQAMQTSTLHYAAMVIREVGVNVQAEAFKLESTDLEYIRSVERISRRNVLSAVEGLNAGSREVAERIQAAVEYAARSGLVMVRASDMELSSETVKQAWAAYCQICNWRDALREVRRRIAAAEIVRSNAALFPAARCANLLDRLEGDAQDWIDRMLSQADEVPTAVEFDPSAPITLAGQLWTAGSPTEKLARFLSRADTTASRSLAYLAWWTLNITGPTP
jgi:Zn-dependent protease with chaperone function